MHAINELPENPASIAHQLIAATTHKTWHTQKGRELVTVARQVGAQSKIHPASVDVDELLSLAAACLEAHGELTGSNLVVFNVGSKAVDA